MTINKLIKECANRNFVKASKLFESELEKKVCEILSDEKEELLGLDDIEEASAPTPEIRQQYAKLKSTLQQQIKSGTSDSVKAAKAALDAFKLKNKGVALDESEEQTEPVSTEACDEEVAEESCDEEVKTEAEDEESEMNCESSDVFDSTLEGGDHLEEEGEHQDKFMALLADYGVESPDELSDEQKKEFFAKLKESEDLEMDFDIEDDFQDMAEALLFGKK